MQAHTVVRARWSPLLLKQQLSLLRLLTRQEVRQRFQGSVLGVGWVFVLPLLMLGVYVFVFGDVLKAKWPGATSASRGEFAVRLFSGLLVFQLFADSINRACLVISSNANYVKKVVFPLVLLPVSAVLAALVNAGIALVLLLVALLVVTGVWHAALLSALFIVLPVVLWALGLSLLFASLGAYFKDLTQLVGVVLSAFMFLSPIFYPQSLVPIAFQSILALNPLALPIEQFRQAAVDGIWPDFFATLRQTGIGFLACCMGWYWFDRTSKGFADVV
jgi:lipopolysaccharide transport system permease protein